MTLAVDQHANEVIKLSVGATTQQVTVATDIAMLPVATSTVGQLVNEKQMVDLPLNGRQPQGLLFLTAGANLTTSRYVITSGAGIVSDEQQASVAGAGPANVNYLMDGAGHTDHMANANQPFPNPDSVQEFNVQATNMSAEYGGSAAVVNIITKSGTNKVHGDVFEFVRNGDLNARNFFAPAQDTLKRNQFGAVIGGPIKKDKLFYFGTYQGTRIHSAAQGRIAFVPTAAEKAGDFSAISSQLLLVRLFQQRPTY
jgi:hypothetical protein